MTIRVVKDVRLTSCHVAAGGGVGSAAVLAACGYISLQQYHKGQLCKSATFVSLGESSSAQVVRFPPPPWAWGPGVRQKSSQHVLQCHPAPPPPQHPPLHTQQRPQHACVHILLGAQSCRWR